MRVDAITLAWFRGAADPVSLDPGSKSIVVYGTNASGKSSFVDAVEYVLNDGRIGHLAHEHSGKHQEKGMLNTHRPEDQGCELTIRFKDGSQLEVCISADGSFKKLGSGASGMDSWDYPRTVLRQDEVANFISSTKGAKYSALVPLLGLSEMEVSAENLRRLAKSVEKVSQLSGTRAILAQLQATRSGAFGAMSTQQIVAQLQQLHSQYCPDDSPPDDPASCREQLEVALAERVADYDESQRRFSLLSEVAGVDLPTHVAAVRDLSSELAGDAEPLVAEKLEALDVVARCLEKVKDEESVDCPACGRSISVEAFEEHVHTERERLSQMARTFRDRKAAIAALCDRVKLLQADLGRDEVIGSCEELASKDRAENLEQLHAMDPEGIRESCGEAELEAIVTQFTPLVYAAKSCCDGAPPDVVQLEKDKDLVKAVGAALEADRLKAAVDRAEALVGFVRSLEVAARDEIRKRSESLMGEISQDIERMWSILHPGEAIDHVHLYVPEKSSKAIDIGLKFHGVEQESPRLTLSEGLRNSLGLCIFLAMAKREADGDRPLFLDDVVVSLDRNHRGMIAELLSKEFSDRQVVLFTHDREWYTELRYQLDAKNWTFKALLPWESPQLGIRWSQRTTTFDDARAHLKERPDSAGNDARKIMDVELAIIAERLKLRGLIYLRGDKNDRRTAFEFLERIIAEGKTEFKTKTDDGYASFNHALELFAECKKLLQTWGNKSSHSFDVVRPEAEKLIDRCEEALRYFVCPSCKKGVWAADVGGKYRQCVCGNLRWG